MPTLTWGAGGTTRSTNTSGAGDGWYTPGLAFPDPRLIYDGTRPIRVVSVAPTAGSGDRTAWYTITSTYQTTGYHTNVSTGQIFTFRITRDTGNIALGLLGISGYTTYWVSTGLPVNWNPNGQQPGQMVWWQAPSAPTVSSITPNPAVAGQVTVLIGAPSDNGGSAVTTYTHQFSTNSAFTAVVLEQQSSASSTVFSGLPTGTTLYHRVMAVNAVTVGVGKKGGAASVTTSFSLGQAPVTAPAIAITPAPSGQSANFTITPPSNTGGLPITKYTITYTPVNLAGTPVGGSTSVDSVTTTGTISGLIPGQRYRWSVIAVNTVGNSPASANVFVTQPNPSTSPGDFFDGSTPATDDQVYSWDGTVNNSTSKAQGHAPTGWATFAVGAATSGGTGVVVRVTGAAPVSSGLTAGTYAARATFFSDATTAGFTAGTAIADPGRGAVIPGQTYTGSLYVSLSRSNRVAAHITWANAAGAVIGSAVGTAQVVGTNTWTRLSVTADAPALSAWASVRVIDVAGADHTNYRGGDVITADAAMLTLGPDLLPYFDGATPDDNLYQYSWTGTANASTSLREAYDQVAIDPLIDPDCPPVPQPPRPPVILDDCIIETGIWRRYWLSIPASEVSDWLTVLPTLILETQDFAIRQVRIRVYPNPFGYPVDQIDPGNFCSEQIISYIPPTTVFTLDGPLQRVFAEVNGGAAIAADHLLYGTGGIPATWPALSCGIAYLASFDVPLDAPVENFQAPRVLLTKRT